MFFDILKFLCLKGNKSATKYYRSRKVHMETKIHMLRWVSVLMSVATINTEHTKTQEKRCLFLFMLVFWMAG